MTEALDRRPSRTGTALALLAGVVAAGALTPAGAGFPIAAAGLAVLGVALTRGSPALLGVGATVQFVGVLVGGLAGAPPEPVLVAAAGTVVAWDVGENALTLGDQLGRAARTDRAEVVHAAASAAVAAVGSGLAYLAFVGVDRGQPTLALVLLLLGAVLLAAALR